MGSVLKNVSFLSAVLVLTSFGARAQAASTPFSGTAYVIPGGFNACDYNRGGEGVAYHDYDAVNNGGVYRNDGVDVRAVSDVGGGYAIGYSVAGEYIEYSINASKAGMYSLLTRMSSPNAGRSFHIEIDGVNKTGSVSIPKTGSYDSFVNITVPAFAITAGAHILRFVAETGDADLRWFQLNYSSALAASATPVPTATLVATPVPTATPTPTPVATPTPTPVAVVNTSSVAFSGVPFLVPGGFNACDYNRGGEGVAYHDYDAVNNGGAYRSEGVDIRSSTDAGGGYAIGYSVAGEYIEYSINVSQAGTYNVLTRMSSPNAGRSFHLEIDRVNVTGSVAIPQTFSYDLFTNITTGSFSLSQGSHVLRFVADTGDADLRWFQVNLASGNSVVTPVATPTPTPVPVATATPVPTATPARDPASVASYKLVEDFSGSGFFSHFNFDSFADPTHGYVTYLDQASAVSRGLASVNAASSRAIISVDSVNVASGLGRAAVRISSKNAYNNGLFIIDVAHMPEGQGVWPAFWSFGPNWPNSGEIDVIEGVNNSAVNAQTLHTAPGCNMNQVNSTATMTGIYNASRDCNSNNAYNGCSTEGAKDSFGPGFNSNGGGVYAYLWTSTKIEVFFWPRSKVPASISQGLAPDPSTWGLPVAHFDLGADCPASYFAQHNLIINTTFCGDWAGNVYAGSNGSGIAACNDYVKNNPSAFVNAYWEIISLRAYQLQ